ncbi:MAG: Glu-tRNA(Gln) amidotransferase subunit GatD [Candidatus Altiarchaeota archaeon]
MVGEAKAGDKVEVMYQGKTHVGILMQRPGLAPSGIVTLKLASGYDIGLVESKVESVRVLESSMAMKRHTGGDVSSEPSLPTVSILSTGGTIASKVDYRTGGVYAASSASDLLESMPELSRLANIRTDSVMNVMSEDMNPKLWVKIAHAVAKELNGGVDGVVVTHGTDTMGYSAAALSFMLRGLGKPVVLTGAQRSTDRGSADSFLNLACAVAFAKSDYAGVYLVMHGSMSDSFCLAHRGTKVRKMHTTRRDAFRSVNSSPVARILPDGKIEPLSSGLPQRSESTVSVDANLEEKVALVKAYPGMDPGILDYHLKKGVRGVVIEGTALGHVPTTIKETSLIPGIEKLISSGVLVAMTTQCLFGRVNPYVYSNLREVSSKGVVYCEDMLPETAYAKMIWALGKSRNVQAAKSLMLQNIAGEITTRTEADESSADLML